MSFEGYSQLICAKGHYHRFDVYCEQSLCPDCGSEFIWNNLVDETNGVDEDGMLPGYVDLKPFAFEDVWHTDHHGNRYATKRYLYKVPGSTEELHRFLDEAGAKKGTLEDLRGI
jgi:DNA repair exonuclease SbcCD nuclease subunit